MGLATMDLAKIDPDTCNNVLGKYGLLNNAPATILLRYNRLQKIHLTTMYSATIDSQIMDSATTVPAKIDLAIVDPATMDTAQRTPEQWT
jgi:hypothetical protein